MSNSQNKAHIMSLRKSSCFYQYTTLESLFQILYNGTQRLGGIAGMNDRSEANFFENLFEKKISYEELRNKTFLMSCSTQKDNLTMWRMYGDEAKGACIEYEIANDYNESEFVIHPVCYIDKENPVKEIIMLQQAIKQDLNLKKFDVWKHFFKPIEFKDEHEIRILFIGGEGANEVNGGWTLNSTKIINPYVEFNLFDESKNSVKFPLKIKSILLGPNCYEADTNIRQLKDLIEQKYKTKLPIDKSSIDIYRSK